MKPLIDEAMRERRKMVIQRVVEQMAAEGKHASSRTIALGLRCPTYRVQELRRELIKEGKIKPHPDERQQFRNTDEENVSHEEVQARIAIVREAKSQQWERTGTLKLGSKQLRRVLPS